MRQTKNVFEAILKYGHDEDFYPEAPESFNSTDAPAGSEEKIEILRKRIEPSSQNLLSGRYNDQRARVFFCYGGFQVMYFCDGQRTHENGAVFAGIHAASIEGSDAASKVGEDAV